MARHWRGGPGVLHDRTTFVAVAIVALGMAAVLAVRGRRRPPPPRRG